MKPVLQSNNTVIYLGDSEWNSVSTERFIRTLKK